MDAAEAWLWANDPDYPLSRQGWKHLNDEGEYETPPEEIPSGLLLEDWTDPTEYDWDQ